MPHPTRLSKAHGAAQSGDRPAGGQRRQRHGYDNGKSAEKVKVLRHAPPSALVLWGARLHTNVFLGVLYVLGAVAALCFKALIDSSCEEVTAYREDAPIDTCTEMLASFAAPRTTTGPPAPASPDFSTKPRAWRAETPPRKNLAITGWARVNERGRVHLSAEYDNTGVPTAYENWDKIENGFRRTFERGVCPWRTVGSHSTIHAKHVPPLREHRCETADFVAGPTSKGYAYVYDSGQGPSESYSTQMMEVTESPAEESSRQIHVPRL